MAGIIQALEADAFRWAIQGSEGVMPGTGVRIVLVNHDESVWEVPTEHAQQAASRAERWMRYVNIPGRLRRPSEDESAATPTLEPLDRRPADAHGDRSGGRAVDDIAVARKPAHQTLTK